MLKRYLSFFEKKCRIKCSFCKKMKEEKEGR